ncbi:MAG: acetyl-CoA carboxylase biotin carboxyl carrier protein subunit [Propionibacteriaceae bacterium]|jgi:biotin carboxyl carrier protein|nr:acetyl-CoA carboxylase biotin carboxyl carrier protein subunit [Propionibacteriaceae bacterium]
MRYTIRVGAADHVLDVEALDDHRYAVTLADGRVVEATLAGAPRDDPDDRDDRDDRPDRADSPTTHALPPPASGPAARRNVGAASPLTDALPTRVVGLAAPLPGVVLAVPVTVGEAVTRGQTVVVLEAMKMKNDIKAAEDGRVARVFVKEGDSVQHGAPLVEFEV